MPSHTFDRSLYSRLSQPAKPVLRQPPVVGNSQNLKPARIFPVNDGERKSLQGNSANIWFQFDLPAFW